MYRKLEKKQISVPRPQKGWEPLLYVNKQESQIWEKSDISASSSTFNVVSPNYFPVKWLLKDRLRHSG